MLKLGVLVSGTGTNLQAILDAIAERDLDAEVRLVISNKPDVPALERAARAGVPTRCIPHRDYASREAFDAALVEALRGAAVEWIVLAGFMRVLTRTFLSAYPLRVVNIHPALLPAFPGVDAQRQALDYGVKVSGCTVHLVDEGTDTGPIIAQRAVAVADDDDVESLKKRVLAAEHATLVDVLKAISRGLLSIAPPEAGRRPRVVLRSG